MHNAFVFIPHDWYWFVGGEEHRVYSTKTGCYVPSNDQAYLAWRDATALASSLVDPTTRIDTEENLAEVLRSLGQNPMPEKSPTTEGIST